MPACPSCGKDLPGSFPFCPFCAAPLEDAPASAAEERKVVSVLFCDLVGFTAASEGVDPEDVRARIRPYHERLRTELERYGGTVEKFIGDAVMAVFGAPVAHEDDAERAVRAGLRILEAIGELNDDDPGLSLQVRVGINTGEAVVALGARPSHGEAIVTGDVVNTAARLQGAAPVNGIACSEQTYRQTERVFDFEELDPVVVKGKAGPVAIWRPVRPRARFGSDVTRAHTTPLVGRELEKPLLIGTFERAAQQRSCQLVTVVGEPGVGKSRLCAELFGYIEDRPGLVRWRQGRCLPYGEGIAFWALGEVVKAECGILESDSADEAAAKLERALPADGQDRDWLRARLAPLVGAPADPVAQEESFAPGRRYRELWAEERETVLVFEDLHWADSAFLSFLEHLADWAQGVPLLVLCSARPELYERYPSWAAGLRNASTINLPPLTDEETAVLIASLLERSDLPPDTNQALLDRAGGNPLFAEEFVRLLADRGGLGRMVDDVPDSVQALIAARLDTLAPDRKSLLQDAAVVGKVFWSGALAEMGGRDVRDAEQALHELARKELVRPARTSAMEGEREFGFWHLLVRDVCYAQIPRADRAARHRAAAAWLERHAGERAEDLADVLAHHYLTALELIRAAGLALEAEEVQTQAIRYLALAGERAIALDVERAEANLARALELAPAGHPARASLLEHWAQAAQQLGRQQEAKAALESAYALHLEQDDAIAAGRALALLVTVLWSLGDPRRKQAIREALDLLEPQPPGPELVAAYAQLSGVHFISGLHREAIAAADQALELASELGLPEPARALGFRGACRGFLGEREGLDDLRRALELSIARGQSREAAVIYGSIATTNDHLEGPQAALDAFEEGVEFCEHRGIAELACMLAAERLRLLTERGLADQALAEAERATAWADAAGSVPASIHARSVQLSLLGQRGGGAGPTLDAVGLASDARATGIPELIVVAFTGAAQLLLAQDRPEQARALLTELEQVPGALTDPYYGPRMPELVRCALVLGDAALAARFVAGVEPRTPLFDHALTASNAQLAEAAGDHARAQELHAASAERWLRFGNVPERAYALLGRGRCLLRIGGDEAELVLAEARDLFVSMGYAPSVAEAEALLSQATAAAP